jgi:hypothetical protein
VPVTVNETSTLSSTLGQANRRLHHLSDSPRHGCPSRHPPFRVVRIVASDSGRIGIHVVPWGYRGETSEGR